MLHSDAKTELQQLIQQAEGDFLEYVVVGGINNYGLGGVGIVSDYRVVRDKFNDGTPRIALVARGDNTFKEKVEVAMACIPLTMKRWKSIRQH